VVAESANAAAQQGQVAAGGTTLVEDPHVHGNKAEEARRESREQGATQKKRHCVCGMSEERKWRKM